MIDGSGPEVSFRQVSLSLLARHLGRHGCRNVAARRGRRGCRRRGGEHRPCAEAFETIGGRLWIAATQELLLGVGEAGVPWQRCVRRAPRGDALRRRLEVAREEDRSRSPIRARGSGSPEFACDGSMFSLKSLERSNHHAGSHRPYTLAPVMSTRVSLRSRTRSLKSSQASGDIRTS